jgi:hypothetical protein
MTFFAYFAAVRAKVAYEIITLFLCVHVCPPQLQLWMSRLIFTTPVSKVMPGYPNAIFANHCKL